MLWLFERDAQSVHLETRYDNDSADYVLVLTWPDGRVETERYTDAEAYRLRLVLVENRLATEHWVRRGPPMLLTDGWPQDPLT